MYVRAPAGARSFQIKSQVLDKDTSVRRGRRAVRRDRADEQAPRIVARGERRARAVSPRVLPAVLGIADGHPPLHQPAFLRSDLLLMPQPVFTIDGTHGG